MVYIDVVWVCDNDTAIDLTVPVAGCGIRVTLSNMYRVIKSATCFYLSTSRAAGMTLLALEQGFLIKKTLYHSDVRSVETLK